MPPAAQRKLAQPLKDSPMLPTPQRSHTGRPSIYKAEYCGLIEQWGKEGKSQAQMCSLLNISRATFHEWKRVHDTFSASASRAQEHAQAWWEAKAQSSLGRKQFQAQLWRYSMQGRFKDDYAEQRQGVDITLNLAHLVESSLGELARPVEAKVIEQASSLPLEQDPAKRGK